MAEATFEQGQVQYQNFINRPLKTKRQLTTLENLFRCTTGNKEGKITVACLKDL